MQKFYGFDSPIGVGRNFGFKGGEVKPPLDKPLILSIGEDIDMAGGVRLEFSQFGSFDSFSVYRATTPMALDNLPLPIATGLSKMYYVDSTVEEGGDYYYRVSARRGDDEVVSDEVFLAIPMTEVATIPTDYVVRYDLDGDFNDKSANLNHATKTGTGSFVAGRKVSTQAFYFYRGNAVIKSIAAVPIDSMQVTISFWMRLETGAFPGTLLTTATASQSVYLEVAYGLTGNGLVNRTKDRFGNNNTQIATELFNNNTWHHVVLTQDKTQPAADENIIYIDNVRAPALFKGGYNFTEQISSSVLTIGNNLDGSTTAVMQDIRIYNRLLTSTERAALFDE